MWLIASPEVLLRGDAEGYQTMALAGTMRYEGEDMKWSTKNQEEQQLVADYIRACLQPFAAEITESKPYTTRAAHLAHLRTDFTFRLKDTERLGTFLTAFHPTPAVCGMPKDEAQLFILHNEQLTQLLQWFQWTTWREGCSKTLCHPPLYATLSFYVPPLCRWRALKGEY